MTLITTLNFILSKLKLSVECDEEEGAWLVNSNIQNYIFDINDEDLSIQGRDELPSRRFFAEDINSLAFSEIIALM